MTIERFDVLQFSSGPIQKVHIKGIDRTDLIMVGGAITTKEGYENFKESICHLFNDGKIRRYGRVIGTIDDIVVINDN